MTTICERSKKWSGRRGGSVAAQSAATEPGVSVTPDFCDCDKAGERKMNDALPVDRSRGWLLTLPEREYPREVVEQRLSRYAAYVGQLEEGGKTSYRHWQIYLENPEPVRFLTLRNLFPKGHFESRRGTKADAYRYVTKKETSLGIHLEKGTIDLENYQGRRTDLEKLRERILYEGESVQDLLLSEPRAVAYVRQLRELEFARNEVRWGRKDREVTARYLWGASGVGKTRSLFDRYDRADVYRVTDYSHPFDRYSGEKVLALDEFDGQISFDLMLNILDRYPLLLPARYQAKWAAFTEVWVIANVPLSEHYRVVQRGQPERWKALIRRFASVEKMGADGRVIDESEDPLLSGEVVRWLV